MIQVFDGVLGGQRYNCNLITRPFMDFGFGSRNFKAMVCCYKRMASRYLSVDIRFVGNELKMRKLWQFEILADLALNGKGL